jgi:protein arginine kinase
MFQVSNQITLGVTEDDNTATIRAVCEQIMAKEHDARDLLLSNKRLETEDKLYRSWGLLKYARSMGSKEFMQLLSDTRLAVALGFITEVDQTDLNRLMIAAQPAALQRHEGRELAQEERDIVRANYIRAVLNKKG